MNKEIEINFTASIKKTKNGLFEVKVKSGDIESIMPARTQEEAVGVAISSAGGFAQFLLGQSLQIGGTLQSDWGEVPTSKHKPRL